MAGGRHNTPENIAAEEFAKQHGLTRDQVKTMGGMARLDLMTPLAQEIMAIMARIEIKAKREHTRPSPKWSKLSSNRYRESLVRAKNPPRTSKDVTRMVELAAQTGRRGKRTAN